MRRTLIAALLAAPAALAFADTSSIYQQRTEDGDVVLTDRPSPTAVTLRSWQVKTPSAAVQKQREAQMKAEADAVSARVQQTIDRQEADAAAEARQRQRAAEREEELRVAETRYGGDTVLDPYGAAPPLVFPYAESRGLRWRDDPSRLGTVYGRSRPAYPNPDAQPRRAPRVGETTSYPGQARVGQTTTYPGALRVGETAASPRRLPSSASPGTAPRTAPARSPGASPTTAEPVSPGSTN